MSDFVSMVAVGMAQWALDLPQHRAEGSPFGVFQCVVRVDGRVFVVSLAEFAALKVEFMKKCEYTTEVSSPFDSVAPAVCAWAQRSAERLLPTAKFSFRSTSPSCVS